MSSFTRNGRTNTGNYKHACLWNIREHAVRDLAFFVCHDLSIDFDCRRGGMSKPTINDMQRYALLDGGDAEPMAQPFWAGLSTVIPGFLQQSLDVSPGSHAGITSKRLVKLILELATTQSMCQVQVFNQNPSNGHGAPTPLLPFLQALKLNDLVIEIDMSDGQKKCFRNATAGVNQGFSESANVGVHASHAFQQRAAFIGINIFSTLRVVQRVTRAFGVQHSIEQVENSMILSEFSLKQNYSFVSRMCKMHMKTSSRSRKITSQSSDHETK